MMHTTFLISALLLSSAFGKPLCKFAKKTMNYIDLEIDLDETKRALIIAGKTGNNTGIVITPITPITGSNTITPIATFLNTIGGNVAGIKTAISLIQNSPATGDATPLLSIKLQLQVLLSRIQSGATGLNPSGFTSDATGKLASTIGDVLVIQTIASGLGSKYPHNLDLVTQVQSLLSKIVSALNTIQPITTPVGLPSNTASSVVNTPSVVAALKAPTTPTSTFKFPIITLPTGF